MLDPVAPQLRGNASPQLIALVPAVGQQRVHLHPGELIFEIVDARLPRGPVLDDQAARQLVGRKLKHIVPAVGERDCHIRAPSGTEILLPGWEVGRVDGDACVGGTRWHRVHYRGHPEALQFQHQVTMRRLWLQQPRLNEWRTRAGGQRGVTTLPLQAAGIPIRAASVRGELITTLEVKVAEVLVHTHLLGGECHFDYIAGQLGECDGPRDVRTEAVTWQGADFRPGQFTDA